jgi:putative aldouronate transport system substrate-binding protein
MIQTFGDQGGITDMAPYIESMRGELNDLFDFLGEELIYRARDPVDGHIYNIYARRMTEARTIPWIRTDWLDALDLPLPTTTDEFVDALRKFKSEDPGNVGNVIPLAMTRDVRNRASTLLESFIDPNLSRKELYVNYVANQFILFPGIKEGARLLNTMYNEGLIDPDHVVYPDDEDSDNLVKQGVVGAMIHNWDYPMRDVPGIMKALKENVPGAEFVPVDCFTNSEGVTKKIAFDAQGILLFIPAQSKNPEGALRYWNWMCKLENRKFLQIGEEGVTHVLDEYGVPKVVEVEGEKIMNSGMNIDYTMVINGLDLGDNESNGIAMGSLYPSVTPDLVGKAYEVAMANSIKMPVVSVAGGLAYENSVMQTLTEKQSAIYNTAIDAPPEEFDAIWDAGIADYLLTAQQAIDDREAGYHE